VKSRAEHEHKKLKCEREELFFRLTEGITEEEFDRRLDDLIRRREENLEKLRAERRKT